MEILEIKKEELDTTIKTEVKTPFRTGHYCSVALCRNSAGKCRVQGKQISFHKIPANIKMRKIWISKCKKKVGASSVVCSEHFDENDFERDLRNELLGGRIRKLLKKDAVPHINLPHNRDKSLTEAALARKERYELKHKKDVMKQYLESALQEYEAQKKAFPETSTQTSDTEFTEPLVYNPDPDQDQDQDQDIKISSVFSLNEKTKIAENTQNVETIPLDYEALFNELLEKHIVLEDRLYHQKLQRKALMTTNRNLRRKCSKIDVYRDIIRKCKSEIKELKKLTKGNKRARKIKNTEIIQNTESSDEEDISFVIPQADIEIY